MIITNFKAYPSATGKKAVEIAKIHEEVARETGKDIQVAVQAMDLSSVASAVNIPVLAQHIDAIGYGSHTGYILPELVKEYGATGTLLNHSEKRLSKEILAKSIKLAKEVGLTTIVCAKTPKEGAEFLAFNPDYIAVEPPELIGGTISVSSAKPEIIENAARLIGSEKLLVGAGIKTSDDVKIAIKLGAKGVLLASGITKADDPKTVLMNLANGL